MAQGIPEMFASNLILVILLIALIFAQNMTCYVYSPEAQHRKELQIQMEAGIP